MRRCVAELGTTWSGSEVALPTTCSRWIGCCVVASAMKLMGSPESTTVCASRKNCAYSVVPGCSPCASRPALISGAKVGESSSSCAMPPPGLASVAVLTSALDRAERMTEVVDGAGIDPARSPEAHAGQSADEGDEVGHAFAQVVARGEKAREVDEVRAGRVDRAGRDQLEIEGALDRAARGQPEACVQRVGGAGI